MPSKVECNVCLESTTIKKTIECLHCHYKSCTQCTERYLLSLEDTAKCMNCNALWDDDFMVSVFSKQFINGSYKKHKLSVMMKKESQKLPQTQLLAERELKKRKAENQIKEIKKQKAALSAQMRRYDRQIDSLKRQIETGNYIEEDQANSNALSGRKCPSDSCKGFLLRNGSSLSCGLCEKEYCKECNAPWEDGHECDKDLRETVQYILNNTTACPSCGMQIQKSEGCDQMWCTDCHTAFSYKTGKIENGYIHNPLYLQWRRQAGMHAREPNDYPCGGLPNADIIWNNVYKSNLESVLDEYGTDNINMFRKYISKEIKNQYWSPTGKPIDKAYMIFAKLHDMSVHSYRVNDTLNHNELRVKWMLGEINDDKFESLISSREKRFSFRKDIGHRINAMLFGIMEVFQRMATQCITDVDQLKTYIAELYNLRSMYNNSLFDLSRKYGIGYGEVPFITNEWKIYAGKMNNPVMFQYISKGNFTYTNMNMDSMLDYESIVDKNDYMYQLVNHQLRYRY